MTSRVYKTAQGKSVDMGRLALQNEKTRAVGNMKVNARGDVVNDNNKVIAKKNEQVNRQYNKQVTSTNRGPQ
jgi:glycine cleavage system H lipoate-binding protein